jgi:hypothetical protein
MKAQCAVDSTFCFNRVRLDVSQGLGESTPTAFLGGDFNPPNEARRQRSHASTRRLR